ncbi:MAG: metal ABC transporter substrate-binding protein [Solirubrobacteraceae bacterium]|nr:metal ABC transporter substrate-binding protein [Solirubrobacteraceae bacterium]
MTPRTIIAASAAALAAASIAACGAGGGDTGGQGDARTAVATTTQVGDLARAVAGDRAEVRQILSPNTDPHDYEPRPSDVAAVSGAVVVLRSGGDLDDWLDGVLRNARSDARSVTLIDAVRTREGDGHGHDDDDAHGDDGGAHDDDDAHDDEDGAHDDDDDGAREDADDEHDAEVDPHWWQDPRNAVLAVQRIRDAMIAADPGGRATYTANAAAYVTRLQALDRAIASCMRSIPAAKRKLVTDHDALGYYADRYGIEVVGSVIPALSTQAQASAGEVARLVREIRAAGVTTIFPQSSVDVKLTRAIARDAGATVGPALYADTLGPRGSAGETYLGALRFNTQALAAGFGGDAARCQL